jgi:transmembrane sensor
MLENETYYKDLVLGFIRNSISEKQVKELYTFIHQQPQKYSLLMDEPDILFQVSQQMQFSSLEIPTLVQHRMEERLKLAVERADIAKNNRKSLVRKLINWRWTAAAVFVVVTGVVLAVNFSTNKRKQWRASNDSDHLASGIKAPELNKAMVTLADGGTVLLSSLSKGLLAEQGNMKLVKLADGQIAYQTKNGNTVSKLQYNTLTNPVGSKVINIRLADGTKVWLNAGSSFTYPVAFRGRERRVCISGEAYFEVAHNTAKPFYVTKKNLEVRVLGTQFNVNAYDNEKDIKVTLLEGSVRVATKRKSTGGVAPGQLTLRPGQQAVNQVSTDGISLVSNINIEQAVAWKDDRFQFQQTNIQEVMRQIARWYNVTIEYRGKMVAINFDGVLSRQASITELLKRFEATDLVRFEIEGNKIIVIANK